MTMSSHIYPKLLAILQAFLFVPGHILFQVFYFHYPEQIPGRITEGRRRHYVSYFCDTTLAAHGSLALPR